MIYVIAYKSEPDTITDDCAKMIDLLKKNPDRIAYAYSINYKGILQIQGAYKMKDNLLKFNEEIKILTSDGILQFHGVVDSTEKGLQKMYSIKGYETYTIPNQHTCGSRHMQGNKCMHCDMFEYACPDCGMSSLEGRCSHAFDIIN